MQINNRNDEIISGATFFKGKSPKFLTKFPISQCVSLWLIFNNDKCIYFDNSIFLPVLKAKPDKDKIYKRNLMILVFFLYKPSRNYFTTMERRYNVLILCCFKVNAGIQLNIVYQRVNLMLLMQSKSFYFGLINRYNTDESGLMHSYLFPLN